MLYRDVELHNAAEANEVSGFSGLRLQRVPESVRSALNPGAQAMMLSPASVEIRFVCDSDEKEVTVTLSCPEGRAEVIPLFGDFLTDERRTITNKPTELRFEYPRRLQYLNSDLLSTVAFSPKVWRLALRGDPVFIHDITGAALRPPRPEELPQRRYLAYGTSITHGGAATAMHLSYANQAAWRLSANLTNLGVSGSAFCEPELADYIAGREDWDFATLALSVNMLNQGFELEVFRERADYMVNTVAAADETRPVVCVSLYTFFGDVCPKLRLPAWKARPEEFRDALREIVENSPHPNVHLVEGDEMLPFTGLTPDLLHPSDFGMINMGENLARRIEQILA